MGARGRTVTHSLLPASPAPQGQGPFLSPQRGHMVAVRGALAEWGSVGDGARPPGFQSSSATAPGPLLSPPRAPASSRSTEPIPEGCEAVA